jgi:uncharacterized alkaline shock family protein YloU
MRLSERAFLLVYTLLFTVVSFIMILIAAGWQRPLEAIAGSLSAPYGRLSFGIVFVLLFLIGIRLLLLSLNRFSDQQALVQETGHGKVKVSLLAVENLVKKTVKQTKGIKDVKATVRAPEGKGLQIQIRIVISPEISVPDLTSELQQTIKDYVMDVIGIEVSEVSIVIDNIAVDNKSRVE